MEDLELCIAGPAGYGIQIVEKLLIDALNISGMHFFAYKEYMSRVRGGSNSTTIRICDEPVRALKGVTDFLIPFDRISLERLIASLAPEGTVLADLSLEVSDIGGHDLLQHDFSAIAAGCGDVRYLNSVVAGYLSGLLGVKKKALAAAVQEVFSKKDDPIVKNNLSAAVKGFDLTVGKRHYDFETADEPVTCRAINGSEAVFLGAVSAGCGMISAYPMSPSTEVLTLGAEHADKFGIITEQAEDEIAAVSMSLGYWYGGGRALVTTSGGGLALMGEAVSLAGMTETPLVIHDAQRPGPATGLPTRTAQEDLNMAVNLGHGEFPRIIYSPGTQEGLFLYSHKSFEMADRYQAPVFLLTDQYILNTYHDAGISVEAEPPVSSLIVPEKGYRRYKHTQNGISPRAVPGYGEAFFTVSGNTHDADGHITEDPDTAVAMTGKRHEKWRSIRDNIDEPVVSGMEKARNIVISWGSVFGVLSEAAKDMPDVRHVHFNQVYPLDSNYLTDLFENKHLYVVENNSTGQFADMLSAATGRRDILKVLKYDGRPWTVLLLREQLLSVMKGI